MKSPLALVHLALVAFVLVWLFGPYALRSTVPLWLAFLVALALELHFFVRGLREGRRPPPRRRVEREEELLLVREGGEELWIPYAGETGEELEALIAEARERERREAEDEGDAPAEEQRPRVPPLRRLAGLGVVGGLALVLWLAETRTGWDALDDDARVAAQQRFSAEASRVAGKRVTIRCDESGEHVGAVQHADGVAVVGGSLAYLTPSRCLDLYRLAFEGEAAGSRTARAIAVLAHEAWHLRGVRDEGATECYALQSGVELGRRLGLRQATARQLMRQQLVENARHGAPSLEYRVPRDCRDGGRLDLDPNDARFP